MNAISTMSPGNVTRGGAIPSRLRGVSLVPAGMCVCGDAVRAADVLRVDFDCDRIGRDGLYLVEVMTHDGVAWMGCRRFTRGIDGALSVDDSGRGDWREGGALDVGGLRVVGYVEQVYRAV
jgi:hypothetical protein